MARHDSGGTFAVCPSLSGDTPTACSQHLQCAQSACKELLFVRELPNCLRRLSLVRLYAHACTLGEERDLPNDILSSCAKQLTLHGRS